MTQKFKKQAKYAHTAKYANIEPETAPTVGEKWRSSFANSTAN